MTAGRCKVVVPSLFPETDKSEHLPAEPIVLIAWLVEVGEEIREDEPLAQLMIPGVSFDLLSPCTGILKTKDAKLGCSVQQQQQIATIEQKLQ